MRGKVVYLQNGAFIGLNPYLHSLQARIVLLLLPGNVTLPDLFQGPERILSRSGLQWLPGSRKQNRNHIDCWNLKATEQSANQHPLIPCQPRDMACKQGYIINSAFLHLDCIAAEQK